MKKYISKMFNLQGLLVDKAECLDEEKTIVMHCRSPRIYCRSEVLSWLQRNSFRYIGQRFKISGSTLNRYVLGVSDCWLIDWGKIQATRIGIDEHSFRGNDLVITVTDLSHHKLLAILKTDRQKILIDFLNSIPEKAKNSIKEVCIDLRSGYKTVIKQCLPEADITADRFHVESLAKRMVDDIRAVIQSEDTGRRGHLKKILLTNRSLLNENEKKKLETVWKKYDRYPALKQAS